MTHNMIYVNKVITWQHYLLLTNSLIMSLTYLRKQSQIFYSFHEDKGGVSEFFQVLERDAYRSPLTLIWKAKDWSSVISSEVSFKDKASMFWLRFSILVVPGMGHTSSPWWWTHASASCAGVHPFFAAISEMCSNISLLCSLFSGLNRGKDWSRKAQRNQHGASGQYTKENYVK